MKLFQCLGDLVHHVGDGKSGQVQQAVQLQTIACFRGNAGQVAILGIVGKGELLLQCFIQFFQLIQAIVEVQAIAERMSHEVLFLVHHKADRAFLRNDHIATILAGGHAGGELLAGEQRAADTVAQLAHLDAGCILIAAYALDDRQDGFCHPVTDFFRTPAREGEIRQVTHHAHYAANHHALGRIAAGLPVQSVLEQGFRLHASVAGRALIWSRRRAARS